MTANMLHSHSHSHSQPLTSEYSICFGNPRAFNVLLTFEHKLDFEPQGRMISPKLECSDLKNAQSLPFTLAIM